MNKPYIGVVGAGSFGTVIANILAENNPVLLYARRSEVVDEMLSLRKRGEYKLHHNIQPTNDLKQVAEQCQVIFPIVSSAGFRASIADLSPFLKPYHILIHGTKGLDIDYKSSQALNRENVRTMSEVIKEESVVVRVGCLAGPNLAKELAEEQPGATVVASHFDEVIEIGQKLLRNPRFQVYGNNDLIGIELCGILKNIIAIASGALSGLGLGENSRALLISRGIVEMIYLGKALGGNIEAFIGLAGVGDLVATCFSKHSRNYTVGYRLAQGETLTEIMETMEELAEGVNTTKIVKQLADYYQVGAPITRMLYKILFEDLAVEKALDSLMKIPFTEDVGFM
ncbi:NAD(P)-dependent glycerol-3-phosphate dehydrogenase [Porifericola rhodea]|uniref:NAD(P)H-dependent glycerol-3-phosphate dehydrogenase n=1 Tax=Porifericola rhodea TaxID=930972 RepID=UPI00266567CD|nr:NAD(P)H-dependent glycerol-3-phosphate dehydrogenase [Porifericola rhodea]WKN32757.1 NAD(P)-dependent glycerol-3-phosphate dehydrogenase [Porifericola rhodea]